MRALDKTRVAYVVSHPIQYQAPLLQRLAQWPGLELEVFFLSDYSARHHVDPGFGRAIDWDVPVLEGYTSRALSSVSRVTRTKPFVPDAWRRIDGDRFDAVWLHGWTQLTQLVVLFAAVKRRVPVLLRGESKPEDRSWARRTMLRSIFRRVSGFLAIGTENRTFFESAGASPERIHMMPYSVDVGFFRDRAREARPNREALRAELGIPAGRPIVLFASKLIERKRPFDLLDAYRRLSPDGRRAPDVQLVFAGDGPLRNELERRIADTGWTTISSIGFRNQTELPALYDLCDVFVLPSAYETWGLVLNEAMCASRPVITTTGVGAAADLVAHGKTGFAIDAGDVDALAARLRELLDDPERAGRMGERALERVSRFDLDACCRGFDRALERVRAV